MMHLVRLSNGQSVILREENEGLAIYQADDPSDVDGDRWWICSINNDGVQVSTTCGDAPQILIQDLKG